MNCLACDKVLSGYQKKFCSRSCAVKINNKGLRRNGKEPKDCLNCKRRLKTCIAKYCNHACVSQYKRRLRVQSVMETGILYKTQGQSRTGKSILIEIRGHHCEMCRRTKWRNRLIPLVMDHINGDSDDNRLANLRLVCGNCDMQLPTYKSKNYGNGRAYRRQRYTDGKSF